jgi:hypothetical protein
MQDTELYFGEMFLLVDLIVLSASVHLLHPPRVHMLLSEGMRTETFKTTKFSPEMLMLTDILQKQVVPQERKEKNGAEIVTKCLTRRVYLAGPLRVGSGCYPYNLFLNLLMEDDER